VRAMISEVSSWPRGRSPEAWCEIGSVALPFVAMASTLVILAAGMSTRYGRLKQLEPMGPGGEALMDYSVFDARKAGFCRVVLIIRRELEGSFRRHVLGRWPEDLEVVFHHQDLDDVPGVRDNRASPRGHGDGPGVQGGSGRHLAGVPFRRRKPWGTAHAVLTARDLLDGPFGVINADDFYGRPAFVRAAGALGDRPGPRAGGTPLFGLLTYTLEDTLSSHGGVSRGICRLEGPDRLQEVEEVLEIRRDDRGIRGTTVSGEEVRLEGSESVSTNFWLLSPEVFPFLEEGFRRFLGEGLRWYPGGGFAPFPGEGAQEDSDDGRARGRLRAGPSPEPEFLLPSEINRILAAGRARVRVVPGGRLFLGITHPEDRAGVVESLRSLVGSGHYPGRLWGEGAGPGTQ
jgi:hypothetical protein